MLNGVKMSLFIKGWHVLDMSR